MQTIPNIKRGDTFAFIASLTDIDGTVLDGILSSLKCEVRDNQETLISTLVILESEIPGEYLFKAEDTSQWPVDCYLYMDIQYEYDGVVTSSEIIKMIVDKDVTR